MQLNASKRKKLPHGTSFYSKQGELMVGGIFYPSAYDYLNRVLDAINSTTYSIHLMDQALGLIGKC